MYFPGEPYSNDDSRLPLIRTLISQFKHAEKEFIVTSVAEVEHSFST